MSTTQYNPARLYNWTKPASLAYSTNTRKYKDWKASVRRLLFNPQNGDLLWHSSTLWVQVDTSFLRYLYFQENIWNQNWWMAHRLDQSTRVIPRGGYRAEIFTQWFLHFIKHTKPTKEDPVILVLDRHYSHTRNLEVIILARENQVDIICLPPHSSDKMQPWIKLSWGPWKHSTAKKLENGSVHTQGESSLSTKLANYSEMHTSDLQQAK